MTQLTKQQAAMLYAYDYKLQHISGKKLNIHGAFETLFICIDEDGREKHVQVHLLGTEYFILARPLSKLAEQIEHNGEKFVPLERLETEHDTEMDSELDIEIECWGKDEIFVSVLSVSEIRDILNSWHFNLGFPEHTVKHLI